MNRFSPALLLILMAPTAALAQDAGVPAAEAAPDATAKLDLQSVSTDCKLRL